MSKHGQVVGHEEPVADIWAEVGPRWDGDYPTTLVRLQYMGDDLYLCRKHPDGQWVTVRKATEQDEMWLTSKREPTDADRIKELEQQLAAANATVEKCKAAGFIDEQGNVASDVHHGGELRQSIELTEFQASVLDNIRHANDQSWKYHPHVPSETQAMETLESLGLVKQETYMVMRAAATCFNITDKGRQWLSQNGTAR